MGCLGMGFWIKQLKYLIMIDYPVGMVRITCDKCGVNCYSTKEQYNDDFFNAGWVLFRNAKKYHHVCRDCQTKKQRKAHDFVARF